MDGTFTLSLHLMFPHFETTLAVILPVSNPTPENHRTTDFDIANHCVRCWKRIKLHNNFSKAN